MTLDPRTPVLVGAAQLTQRAARADDGVEALELMHQAVEAAGLDAAGPTGAASLLAAVGQVTVPQGTWAYPDPGRLIADRVGAVRARTVLAEIGVLQQDALADACVRIARGEVEVALVVGGEAKHRAVLARSAGTAVAPDTRQPEGTAADRVWKAPSLGVHDVEILRHAVDPSTSYALLEGAIGHAAGRSAGEHLAVVGAIWERFGRVAAGLPDAWDRSAPTAAEIIDPEARGNRMIATPYTKRCCSQWNVDQAVAIVLCSAAAAERFRVPRDRWVFPHSSAVSNHALPVIARADLHRCPGADVAGRQALGSAGLTADDLTSIDLYSCFPAAVQMLANGLDLALDDPRDLTVTGGMTFFGGPLNSYVLHALATMVPVLRGRPDARGLSSSVSGFLVKQGFGVWSAAPPHRPFRHDDVSREVAEAQRAVPVDEHHTGPAVVVAATVVHGRQPGEHRAVAICATPAGARTIATSTDPDVVAACADGDPIGRRVTLPAPDVLALP